MGGDNENSNRFFNQGASIGDRARGSSTRFIFNPCIDSAKGYHEFSKSKEIWKNYENRWEIFVKKTDANPHHIKVTDVPWPPNAQHLMYHMKEVVSKKLALTA
jgi:hypothetical protein